MRAPTSSDPDLPRLLRRALQDLERQSAALLSAAADQPGCQRIGFDGFRTAHTANSRTDPTENSCAEWVSPFLEGSPDWQSLRAYPGHLSASTLERPYLGVGYVLNQAGDDDIEAAVGTVTALLRQRRDFTPVFITSSTYVTPFLRHGFIFEYVPPRRHFGGDDLSYEVWRDRRIAFIRQKWKLSSLTELGIRRGRTVVDARPRLIFFPDYREANPYQQLMYSAVDDRFALASGSIESAIESAACGPTIFHLHWEDAVTRIASAGGTPEAMARFVRAIDTLRERGGRFVWTVHNALPHDSTDVALDAAFAAELVRRADLLHVHDEQMAALVRPRVQSGATLMVIPHPGYPTHAEGPIDRYQARAALGVGEADTLFLCLGNVRRYKGLETVLNAAAELLNSPARFLLAGRSAKYDPRTAPPSNCVVADGFLDPEEVARAHAAADFAVLPFHESSTSGSLMLTLSFGVPVIAPAALAGHLVEHGREGLLYVPEQQGALVDTLRTAIDTPSWRRLAMGEAARATAALRSPAQFSEAVASALTALMAAPRDESG